jgi:hypothetical protein
VDTERRNPENARIRGVVGELQDECRQLALENQRAIADVKRRVTWILTFTLIVLFALGAATFYLRGQDELRAAEAKQIALAIQQNRVAQCVRDNQRHAKLEVLLTDARNRAKTPAQRAQVELFVNLVAEKRDCSALLIRR